MAVKGSCFEAFLVLFWDFSWVFLFLAYRLCICSDTSNGPGLSCFKMINRKRDHRE